MNMCLVFLGIKNITELDTYITVIIVIGRDRNCRNIRIVLYTDGIQ